MFRFASPWFLMLLLVPWGYLVINWRQILGIRRAGGAAGLRVPSLSGLGNRPVSMGLRVSRLLPVIQVIALSLMIIALARPQAGDRKVKMMTEGVNIILALDLSESMRALDFKRNDKIVTRLNAVKGVVAEFIMKREGDRIGMVVFGSNAFTQLPLTRDYNTIAFMLDHLKIGAAGPSTAIGDAIGISLKRLADVRAESNIIILLTDGESNAGQLSWEEAIRIAAKRGVKIHTIGVGSKGKAPFLVDGLFGKQYVHQQVNVDYEALKTIADTTGGSFFKAENTKALEEIYTMIDRMEKTRVEVDKWVEYRELYNRFLIPGMLIYLFCLVLSNTRYLRIP
ncbi:MAG: VWA domain-containing protein [Desulfobacterales bacterium]|nr:VWA domain-containing protein [Desulfobacterales bacterium]